MSETELKAQIQSLQAQLERERAARKQAETLFHRKAVEMREVQHRETRTQQRLQQALYASGETVWEWDSKIDRVQIYLQFNQSSIEVKTIGNFEQSINRICEKSRESFLRNWELHRQNKSKFIDETVRYESHTTGTIEWARICGQFISRNSDGEGTHFIGIFKQVTKSYEKQLTQKVVTDAYRRMTSPGFIIRTTPLHIEITASLYELLGFSKDTFSITKVSELLPVAEITTHESNGDLRFKTNITSVSGQSISCEITLTKLLNNEEDNHVIAGFLSLQ